MKNNIQKLIDIGCGSAIIESCVERSKITAVIYNAQSDLKYYRYCVKSNLLTPVEVLIKAADLLNEVNKIKPLVDKYHELYMDKYCKLLKGIEHIKSVTKNFKNPTQ